MQINFLISYQDSESEDWYEDHAETLKEAQQVEEALIEEGFKKIKIERIRQ